MGLREAVEQGIKYLDMHLLYGLFGNECLDKTVKILEDVGQGLLLRFELELLDHDLAIL